MSIKLKGATSGSVELDVPADCTSDLNVTVPASTGTIAVLTSSLVNASNDSAAATAGVAVNGLYRNGSILMIRVS